MSEFEIFDPDEAARVLTIYEFIKRQFCYECQSKKGCDDCIIGRIREQLVTNMNDLKGWKNEIQAARLSTTSDSRNNK